MKHYYVNDDLKGDHYAISHNSNKEILVQIQENGEQVRLPVSLEQAEHIITLLQENINKAKNNNL